MFFPQIFKLLETIPKDPLCTRPLSVLYLSYFRLMGQKRNILSKVIALKYPTVFLTRDLKQF
jgi:hypothetical protein